MTEPHTEVEGVSLWGNLSDNDSQHFVMQSRNTVRWSEAACVLENRETVLRLMEERGVFGREFSVVKPSDISVIDTNPEVADKNVCPYVVELNRGSSHTPLPLYPEQIKAGIEFAVDGVNGADGYLRIPVFDNNFAPRAGKIESALVRGYRKIKVNSKVLGHLKQVIESPEKYLSGFDKLRAKLNKKFKTDLF